MTIKKNGHQALNSHHYAIWVPSAATAFCTGRARQHAFAVLGPAQIPRRRAAPRAGDLLGDPLAGWICCHIGPDEPSPLQTQDDQPVEQFEPDRRNDEQIDASDVGGVIAQESLPTWRAGAVTP